MGFLDKIKSWFKGQKETTIEQEGLAEESTDVLENDPIITEETLTEPELTEEEQQFVQIKQLIESDDMSNHELAAMFMIGLGVKWDREMYQMVSQSADKMIFWASQEESNQFLNHFSNLVISPRFFGQYSEIAQFAAVLPKFRYIEELQWKAKHYWNQHPILVAASQLPRLKRLYVEDCKMNFLPESLIQAKTLEELYLSNNKLTEMPADLEQLAHLRILDLSGNEFKKCPRSVCNLKKLEVLRLHKNPIDDVEPRMLGRLYKLRDLQLPDVIAEFNLDNLKDWLPDVDFQKDYWKFD